MSSNQHDPAFEQRVQAWEGYYRAATTREEFHVVEKLAHDSGEKIESLCGLVRSTRIKP